jgi:hypothetical protein
VRRVALDYEKSCNDVCHVARFYWKGIWYLNNNVYLSAAFGPALPAVWSLVGP